MADKADKKIKTITPTHREGTQKDFNTENKDQKRPETKNTRNQKKEE